MEEQSWQQFLTEKVLGEIFISRTFTNRSDLMDLFEMIWRLNKWTYFIDSAMRYWPVLKHKHNRDYFMAWLFCLDGKGYEERCKMIAEFYGRKNES
jgi:hypothetical protein